MSIPCDPDSNLRYREEASVATANSASAKITALPVPNHARIGRSCYDNYIQTKQRGCLYVMVEFAQMSN